MHPLSSIDIVSRSPEETHKLGKRLAGVLGDDDVVFLSGPLGSGKTVVAKGIAEGLRVAEGRDVLSPSFTLVRSYSGERELHHVDLYRVSTSSDAGELVAMAPHGILVIEWPERGEGFLPEPTWTVAIEFMDSHRRLTIAGPDSLLRMVQT
ncbi:tRNA (adenosine(37)-N6)-threonylcarbamoyltransferase complex ATPase subunit type 1 TsaE [Candidatus Fermentibacteria bacterium]|nr:tRNA (adenosine(37)-N6)-threonylcarbamoyltransferase complex ATPase subunit type 1 TsaE [Candidatus Fermentibacteria bacterium]